MKTQHTGIFRSLINGVLRCVGLSLALVPDPVARANNGNLGPDLSSPLCENLDVPRTRVGRASLQIERSQLGVCGTRGNAVRRTQKNPSDRNRNQKRCR